MNRSTDMALCTINMNRSTDIALCTINMNRSTDNATCTRTLDTQYNQKVKRFQRVNQYAAIENKRQITQRLTENSCKTHSLLALS